MLPQSKHDKSFARNRKRKLAQELRIDKTKQVLEDKTSEFKTVVQKTCNECFQLEKLGTCLCTSRKVELPVPVCWPDIKSRNTSCTINISVAKSSTLRIGLQDCELKDGEMCSFHNCDKISRSRKTQFVYTGIEDSTERRGSNEDEGRFATQVLQNGLVSSSVNTPALSEVPHNILSPVTAARSVSISCLTKCRSCEEYQLPVISDEESLHLAEFVALDCEFVGVGFRKTNALGRCSIVDFRGQVLLDRFVHPAEPVTDYRTRWSGLRPQHLQKGIPLELAKQQVTNIIKDKIVVGHAIHNDFRVLCIPHPLHRLRDTASCKILREKAALPNNACALRKLTQVLLGRTIQQKEHCSVTDARACMDLFRLVRAEWEPILQAKLQRRQARALPDTQLRVKMGVAGDSYADEEDMRSYLDDQYWPADMFKDHHDLN